ncbi:LysR family transcriptional regulator [Nonomuraea rhizosphaerae]|uniref:LysR family transcriptional regulator n=1 Tax=Nonomuraea rhizosphaerae TaxID=2665663 RepID=UPI001C5D2365|nr:LysR family transcriptional regulator [Nonomuraea rhizosphaerae]
MDVAWLEVFTEVAARKTFTAAGEALGYTQSAVSRQMASLESELGVALFERHARGVELTEEGRRLLRHAVVVLDRLAAARHDLREAGRLRVGAFDTAGADLVPRAVAAFRKLRPGVTVSLVEKTTGPLLAGLGAGEVDLAVVSAYPGRPLEQDRFVLHHLMDDPLLVAMPAGHRLAGRSGLRLAELAGEPWIEGFPGGSQTLIDVHRRAGLLPRIDFAAREWTAKQGFVAAGLGLALVPSLAAGAIRPDLTLLTLVTLEDEPVRTVYAATRKENPPPRSPPPYDSAPHGSSLCRELIDCLRASAAAGTPPPPPPPGR